MVLRGTVRGITQNNKNRVDIGQVMESKQEVKSKHKKRFKVIMEIVFMAFGVLCGIMPQPFPLLVPILIGTVRIVGRALEKEPEPPSAPVVYCNGQNAPDKPIKTLPKQKPPAVEASGARKNKTSERVK